MNVGRVIEGRVTGLTDRAIEGWVAADPSGAEVHVEAVADQEGPFGRARAAPGPDGRLHFAIEIPPALRDGRVRFLDVRPLGDDRPLAGGPMIYDGGLFDTAPPPISPPAPDGPAPSFLVEGQVAFIPPNLVEGWAWAPDKPDLRLKLEILAGGRFIAGITADKLREDLQADGVGDARYGFRFDASKLLRRGPHMLTVRVEGVAEPLPGGPFRVGPFAADGEADCPGYLDTDEARAALEALPFEHLAFDARRIAPERLAPRLINRLRRERAGFDGSLARPAALLLLGAAGASPARETWALQSWPATSIGQADAGARAIRDLAAGAEKVIFARPHDLIHPSAAAIAAAQDADVVSWNRFCADQGRAGEARSRPSRPSIRSPPGTAPSPTRPWRSAALSWRTRRTRLSRPWPAAG